MPEPLCKTDSRSPFSGIFLGEANSIAHKLPKWKIELENDIDRDFLLSGIESGFRISDIDTSTVVKKVECDNHPSALKYSEMVEKELKSQLALGYYVIASCRPLIVSPLGAIKKEDCDEVRIIHDGSRPLGDAMNDYSTLYSVRYQTLHEAYELAKPGFYLAKVDLKSAYRSVPISCKDYCLTGLKWCFQGQSSPTYMFDTRLCFGARLAPASFHRIMQAKE